MSVCIATDPAKDEAELDKNVLYADLPYMLERLVPQLASAVDGDTATKVKQHAGSQ